MSDDEIYTVKPDPDAPLAKLGKFPSIDPNAPGAIKGAVDIYPDNPRWWKDDLKSVSWAESNALLAKAMRLFGHLIRKD